MGRPKLPPEAKTKIVSVSIDPEEFANGKRSMAKRRLSGWTQLLRELVAEDQQPARDDLAQLMRELRNLLRDVRRKLDDDQPQSGKGKKGSV